MKKVLLLFFVLALVMALPLAAFADEEPAGDAVEISAPSAEEPAPSEVGGETAPNNFFADLYAWLRAKSGEILSCLAALGSVGVVFLFRRGLIPLLTDAVRALTGMAGKISEKSDKCGEDSKKALDSVNNSLQSVVDLLENVKGDMTAFADRIESLEAESGQRKMLSTVLLSEVDMLSEIFLSSSLPQYRKEEVGERIAAMRREIARLDEVKE